MLRRSQEMNQNLAAQLRDSSSAGQPGRSALGDFQKLMMDAEESAVHLQQKVDQLVKPNQVLEQASQSSGT